MSHLLMRTRARLRVSSASTRPARPHAAIARRSSGRGGCEARASASAAATQSLSWCSSRSAAPPTSSAAAAVSAPPTCESHHH